MHPRIKPVRRSDDTAAQCARAFRIFQEVGGRGPKFVSRAELDTPAQIYVLIFKGSHFLMHLRRVVTPPSTIHLYTRPQGVVLLLRAPQHTLFSVQGQAHGGPAVGCPTKVLDG